MKRTFLSAIAFAGCIVAAHAGNNWEKAASLLAATEKNVQSADITAVERNSSELERALADAHDTIEMAARHNVILTDGAAETLMALSAAATDKSTAQKSVQAVQILIRRSHYTSVVTTMRLESRQTRCA